MDWKAAIETNRQALKRVMVTLVAMACITADCRPTLPRHLHRAVLRLLRPAEAAARRLIIVAAHGLVVTPPPARPRKREATPAVPAPRSFGIAAVMPSAGFARLPAGQAAKGRATRTHVLPLFDPVRLPGRARRRFVPAHAAPRICVPGATARHRLPPPPAPDDPLDATRLNLRLRALAAALDDLPKHAHRFARWRARQSRSTAHNGPRRLSPLKPGRPPGYRLRPTHEIHGILADLHHFAREALDPPDTS
ncbi:hypothetical protein [Mesorhizobium sp. CAU 1732]|uniref:hypothetical protein n=1 Tax=Mesorhizobium sp. CAU 1732 TaxID=3140358 RepID=UPI003260ACF5